MIRTSIYGVHINAQGRVLLVKDSHSHLWGFPGGGVEEGESHADTLRREFLEETELNAAGDFRYITQQHDAVKQRYFYEAPETVGDIQTIGNGSDIECAAYFNMADLPSLKLAPGIKMVIKHLRTSV